MSFVHQKISWRSFNVKIYRIYPLLSNSSAVVHGIAAQNSEYHVLFNQSLTDSSGFPGFYYCK